MAGRDAFKLGAMPVVADVRATFELLEAHLGAAHWDTHPDYRAEVSSRARGWKTLIDEHLIRPKSQRISQGEVIRTLNRFAKSGDVVVAAAGSPPADVHKLWDHSAGTEVHIEFGFSCMGHEVPAAIGYKLARPDYSEVYVVMGEGTWLLGNPEIVSAVQEGLKITVVLVTNDGYQSIRDLQERKTGQLLGTELRRRSSRHGQLDGEVLPIDFAANARSLGCLVFEVNETAELERALSDARGASLPVVIVCAVEARRMLPTGECWWDVGIAETSERAEMRAISEVHLKERESQRFYYSGGVSRNGGDSTN